MVTEGLWTVTELCQYIKSILDANELLRSCMVKGEISNVSQYPSGHLYMTLKDGASQISGVMFAPNARRLKFKPEDGMKVLAYGRVSIFAGRSQYQLVVEELQPEGLGELYVAFLQLKEKLEKEGLFAPAHKRPIPFFPRTIGIVTSLQGAVIHDMTNIIARRNPSIALIVTAAAVQGADAPAQLISGLKRLQKMPEIELIIIARGGGSPEELWGFNDEGLAREIYQCSVPVISAVGHETDFTIADFVADHRAPTPSAAAELVAPHRENLWQHLSHCYDRLRLSLVRKLEHDEKRLVSFMDRPVFRLPFERIERGTQQLDMLNQRLEDRFSTLIERQSGKIDQALAKLESLNPMGVLKRGYSLVIKKGELIKSAEQAKNAGNVKLLFHDGDVDAAILAPQATRKKSTAKTLNGQESLFNFLKE